jgi:hypothetical protein
MTSFMSSTSARLYAALGCSFISLGIGFMTFLTPQLFGKIYGFSAASPAAVGYQQALGIRDAALGLVYTLLYRTRDVSAIESLLLAHGFIGLGDAGVLWLNDGNPSRIPVHLLAGLLTTGVGVGFRSLWPADGVSRKMM